MKRLLVRGSVLIGFLEACQQLSVDPEPILKKHQVLRQSVGNPQYTIPLQTVISVLADAALSSACPCFGLLSGSHWNFGSMGQLSLVGLAIPTLRDMNERFIRLSNKINQGLTLRSIRESNTITIACDINATAEGNCLPMVEHFVSRQLAVTRTCMGESWIPKAVLLKHKPLINPKEYQRILKSPVIFENQYDGIAYGLDQLSLPINMDQAEMKSQLDAYLEDLLPRQKDRLSEKIKLLINDLYLTEENVDLTRIAKILSMPSRTLQYRLKTEGVTFRQLLAEVQAKIAQNMLSQQRASIVEVAELLGFSEVSAFSRSFRNWHGYPPSKCL